MIFAIDHVLLKAQHNCLHFKTEILDLGQSQVKYSIN